MRVPQLVNDDTDPERLGECVPTGYCKTGRGNAKALTDGLRQKLAEQAGVLS